MSYTFQMCWDPNDETPPGIESWRVRLIHADDKGVVTLRALDDDHVQQLSGRTGGAAGVTEIGVAILASELAKTRRAYRDDVAVLRQRINDLGVEVAALRQREHEASQPGVLRRLWERL